MYTDLQCALMWLPANRKTFQECKLLGVLELSPMKIVDSRWYDYVMICCWKVVGRSSLVTLIPMTLVPLKDR